MKLVSDICVCLICTGSWWQCDFLLKIGLKTWGDNCMIYNSSGIALPGSTVNPWKLELCGETSLTIFPNPGPGADIWHFSSIHTGGEWEESNGSSLCWAYTRCFHDRPLFRPVNTTWKNCYYHPCFTSREKESYYNFFSDLCFIYLFTYLLKCIGVTLVSQST